jgi:CheY-like chemotaxis protein
MNTPLVPVLAAEDEETDRFILQRAFSQAMLNGPLILVPDGQQAIDYLNGAAPYHDRTLHPFPVLLLLDLKMPRMTGFDVLTWLKARPEFERLPVVVLTSSAHDSDIQKARELGARDYIVKPHDFSQLVDLMRQLGVHWLQAPDLRKS